MMEVKTRLFVVEVVKHLFLVQAVALEQKT